MKKVKHKLLVLIDLSKASNTVLKNAINLAKVIDGSIEVFYAKELTNIVKNENQISALRALKEEESIIKKEVQNIINTASKGENIPISFDFVFGNVKNEIIDQIDKTKPDIIVLGKSKQNVFSLLKENLTHFLLNNYFGNFLIVGENESITLGDETSIGFYADTLKDCNIEITKELSKKANHLIKLFNVRKKFVKQIDNKEIAQLKSIYNKNNIINYEFEESAEAMSNFVSKNNIELLCLGRRENKKGWANSFLNQEIYKGTQKLKIPLFIYENINKKQYKLI